MSRRSRWGRWGDLAVPVVVVAIEAAVWGGDTYTAWGSEAPVWAVLALLVIGHLPLVARRRRPVTVFVAILPLPLLVLAFPGLHLFLGLLVALYAVARRGRPGRAVAALVACVVPWTVQAWSLSVHSFGVGPAEALTYVVLWTAIGTAVWGIGRADRLRVARAARREEELVAAAERARAAERRALARELHDSVAGSLGGMILQAAGARAVLAADAARAGEALEVIERSGVQALREMRRLLVVLRQEVEASRDADAVAAPDGSADDDARAVHHPSEAPGLRAFAGLLDAAHLRGLDVRLVRPLPGAGAPPLDPSVDLAAYRLIQECLSNAERHGGPGTRVTVDHAVSPDAFTVTVAARPGTTGPPVDLPSSGTGLAGLTERVELLGGTLTRGWADGEFVVRAELPCLRPVPAPPVGGLT